MRECWINVYCYNGKYWQGFCYGVPYPLSKHLIYRIHVRLK